MQVAVLTAVFRNISVVTMLLSQHNIYLCLLFFGYFLLLLLFSLVCSLTGTGVVLVCKLSNHLQEMKKTKMLKVIAISNSNKQ